MEQDKGKVPVHRVNEATNLPEHRGSWLFLPPEIDVVGSDNTSPNSVSLSTPEAIEKFNISAWLKSFIKPAASGYSSLDSDEETFEEI